MSKAESKRASILIITLLICGLFAVFIDIPIVSASSILGYNGSVDGTLSGLGDSGKVVWMGPWTATTTGQIGPVYLTLSSGTPNTIYAAIYTDSSNSPNTLIQTSPTAGVANGTDGTGFYTVALWSGFTATVTSGQKYWFAFLSSSSWGPTTGSTGSWVYHYQTGLTYPNFPTTADESSGSTYNYPINWGIVLSDPFTVSNISAVAFKNIEAGLSAQWTTNETLSHYIVQTNRTGTPVNETAQAFTTTWSNYTSSWILANAGTLEWQIYANTTLGLWANTGLQQTTILDPVYSYRFNGVYDENTARFIGGCNITAYFDDGTVPYSFFVNGSRYDYYPLSQPLYFEYNIWSLANTTDTTITRQYWLQPTEVSGNYNIFGNEIGLVHIIFQIRALGGVGLSSFLEVQRIINGTYQTVEQRQVDATGVATMSLQPYTIYRVIAWSGSTSTTFGNINTYTTQITLTLSALNFPNEVLMQYKYLRIWASRPSSTEIQISYEDTNLQTDSVSYQLAYANGTVAYSATHTGENSFVDVWSGAAANTTYYLTANVSQSTFGYSTFAQVLLRDGASTSPIDLSFLGDWPIDATQIFWAFIVFIVFGVGSVLNAYIGGFAGVATAAVLVWLGWLQVPAGGVVAAFCIVIMVGIVHWKRRS